MSSPSIIELGDQLLRFGVTFLAVVLAGFAFGLSGLSPWGWAVALSAIPVAYAVRAYGEHELRLDEALDARQGRLDDLQASTDE